MALSKNHPMVLAITTVMIMAVLWCGRCCSAEDVEISPVMIRISEMRSKRSSDEMRKYFEQLVVANETDADEGGPSSKAGKVTEDDMENPVKELPSLGKEGCLALTYNDTKLIYSFPKDTYYIWFKPLTQDTVLKLQFDYSFYREGGTHFFPDYTKYKYQVEAGRWHRIELVVKKPENSRRLRISEIEVDEVLPHPTIAHLQVSTNKSLALWTTCPPQGPWWAEEATVTVTTIALAVCLCVTLLVIILLGIYVCCISHKLKKIQLVATDEPLYAQWKDIVPKEGSVSVTPPSSASYTSKDMGTMQTVFI